MLVFLIQTGIPKGLDRISFPYEAPQCRDTTQISTKNQIRLSGGKAKNLKIQLHDKVKNRNCC